MAAREDHFGRTESTEFLITPNHQLASTPLVSAADSHCASLSPPSYTKATPPHVKASHVPFLQEKLSLIIEHFSPVTLAMPTPGESHPASAEAGASTNAFIPSSAGFRFTDANILVSEVKQNIEARERALVNSAAATSAAAAATANTAISNVVRHQQISFPSSSFDPSSFNLPVSKKRIFLRPRNLGDHCRLPDNANTTSDLDELVRGFFL